MGAKKISEVSKKDLITLDEAVTVAREFFRKTENVYTRRGIQNKIHKGELNRYGPYHMTMIDKQEFLDKCCKPFA